MSKVILNGTMKCDVIVLFSEMTFGQIFTLPLRPSSWKHKRYQSPTGGFTNKRYQSPTGSFTNKRYQSPTGSFTNKRYQSPTGGFTNKRYQSPTGGFMNKRYQSPTGGFTNKRYQSPTGGFTNKRYQSPTGGFTNKRYQSLQAVSWTNAISPYRRFHEQTLSVPTGGFTNKRYQSLQAVSWTNIYHAFFYRMLTRPSEFVSCPHSVTEGQLDRYHLSSLSAYHKISHRLQQLEKRKRNFCVTSENIFLWNIIQPIALTL
jgi:hypothetical protein